MKTLCATLLGAVTIWAQTVDRIAPGQTLPAFRLADQKGRTKTFEDIRGPNGAMLVFYRSADW